MVMVSTSILNIKWTIKGKPKSLVAAIGGDLIIKVDSQFTLNQISGQVIEHEERWDVSSSSAVSQAFFWASRYLFASTEAGKDLADSVSNLTGQVSTEKQNLEMFPDPSGDPSKVSVLKYANCSSHLHQSYFTSQLLVLSFRKYCIANYYYYE